MKKILILVITVLLIASGLRNGSPKSENKSIDYSDILSYEINPKEGNLHFFSVDENAAHFKNHGTLKNWLSKKNQNLVFAMNGGMYQKDLSPQGLYIENGQVITKIDTRTSGYGNFYLQPNGIFIINTDREPQIVTTEKYVTSDQVKYATQSGPMLVIGGEIHSAFNKGSKNVHIRNGVGILPNGNLLFAMSKQTINFFRFASFFKENACQNALYLDGYVSRTYLPSKSWEQEDGTFGIIIAEIE